MTDNTLTIFKGDNVTLFVQITESDASADISGFSFIFTVKDNISEPQLNAEIIKSSDIASEITLINPSIGEIEIYILPNDTKNLSGEGRFYYDIQMTTATGEIYTIVQDYIFIKEDVTK